MYDEVIQGIRAEHRRSTDNRAHEVARFESTSILVQYKHHPVEKQNACHEFAPFTQAVPWVNRERDREEDPTGKG